MSEQRLLSGWGRSTWSRAEVVAVTDRGTAEQALATAVSPVIARGLGRSYGDQATAAGGRVLDMTGTAAAGVPTADGLVTVDGGLSLDQLLVHVVPRGWFVPVTPGTRHVTIGGAIAADIHGKNHHADGTFSSHVREISLLLADGSVRRCGPDVDADAFWATVGGMGLTGVILDATIRLQRIESSRLLVDTTRFDHLDELMVAMVEADATARFSVAWVDLMARRGAGRSVLTAGDFAGVDQLRPNQRANPLAYSPGTIASAPAWVPKGLLRTATVRAFNEAWFRAAPRRRRGELQSIGRFFHPLDGVDRWNHVYGRQGFVQWQMAVPDGAEDTLRRCVETLTASPTPCFLAVLKRFGPANPAPLSFPLAGWTLAADMPAMQPGLAAELDALDTLVAAAGGRIYLAKDARLDPALVPVMYPRLDEWREECARLDPHHVFRSDMDRRLRLRDG